MIETIKNLPSSPGIYQYFDANDKLLYIGKAKNLKNRVKSYWRFTPEFQPNPSCSSRILIMLNEATRIEYIVVDTEEDSLILENSLIKQLKPKYNILLRDDKTYPYIFIDESEDFPRFELTRKIVKGKDIKYYGPFSEGGKRLLKTLYETFPLIQKKSCLKGGKACLFHQINKCPAPCEGKISKEDYWKIVDKAKKSIVNRDYLIKTLEDKMLKNAEQERFEEAAEMRDRIKILQSLSISSNVDLANDLNLDIFAILNGDDRGVVVRMFLRDGKIISSSYSYFRHTHIFDENEAYKQTLLEFYKPEKPNVSSEIIVAHNFEDLKQVEKTLSERFGKNISLSKPDKGSKKKLIQLALKNCEELLRKKGNDTLMEQEIAHLLDLSVLPHRIETFDNSHMMGSATVGGMVVWNEDDWDKSSYRRYELQEKDEYGQMRELLSRRIEKFSEQTPPDLWILDGGQANLNLAKTLLHEANVNLDVIAIAKAKLDSKAHRAKGSAKDLIYTEKEILELKPSDKRLMWIQRQRDEAHRYAITYHQNKKRREDTQVSLLNKKGIGKATVKKLIDYFGTFENIQNASFEEISQVTNKKIAETITKKDT